jgi:DNA/RNA endonuclease YhcR with UshA esterase domain
MRTSFSIFFFEILFLIFFAINGFSAARHVSPEACVLISEASKHLGAAQCVRGLVQHVADGTNGTKLLNFCKNKDTSDKGCTFSVVILAGDLKKMGDLSQLEGRQIEIKGTIQDYDGRTEMVLRNARQLGDSAFLLVPAVPTEYDVERHGRYSAGKYSRPKAPKKKNTKQGTPVSIEDTEEPQ